MRTIKFWEEKGLIAPHRRTEGGFRLYRPGDVVLLSFIKDLQAFNYTLAEIGTILGLAGPDLGVTDADLAGMPLAELEKAGAALEYLVERMREVRDASARVETVFARRLRAVSRVISTSRRSRRSLAFALALTRHAVPLTLSPASWYVCALFILNT